MPQPDLPEQVQERVSTQLVAAERQMLKFELSPEWIGLKWPAPPSGRVARWVCRLVGLGGLVEFLDEQLTRNQRLMTCLHVVAENVDSIVHQVEGETYSMSTVLGKELIPQVNRQTNAISSLLDRLQFYERNIKLLNDGRRKYDRALQQKLRQREAEKLATAGTEGGETLSGDELVPCKLCGDSQDARQHQRGTMLYTHDHEPQVTPIQSEDVHGDDAYGEDDASQPGATDDAATD